MALDRRRGIDDLKLVGIGGDLEIVARHHRDHRKQRALRLPALGAAADMIVGGIAFDPDLDRIAGAFAMKRPAGEISITGLDAVIDGRMDLDGTVADFVILVALSPEH
jgi:hypothetical protein